MARKPAKVEKSADTEGAAGAGQPADTPQVPAEGHTAGQGGEADSLPASDAAGDVLHTYEGRERLTLVDEAGNALTPAAGAAGDGGLVDPNLVRWFSWPKRIRVVGPEKGRRRAGMRFSREPVDLDIADLTDEALAALDADPELKIAAADT